MKVELISIDPPEQSGGSMSASTEGVSKVKAEGIVFYSDGSARTNPGAIGSGVHGYTWKTTDAEVPLIMDHITTDQGYLKKTEMHKRFNGKVAVPVETIDYVEIMMSFLEVGTNNQAEIHAVLQALKYANENDIRKISIRADSQYTRQGLTEWCAGWVRNGWVTSTGGPVLNVDLWKEAYALYLDMHSRGFHIEVHWIRAHDDNVGNIQADALAGMAANYSVAGEHIFKVEVFPAKTYWKVAVEKNPMLACKRIYYNTHPSNNVPGCYFQADAGGPDHLIGKRLSETALSIVRLKEPDKIVESIKQKSYDTSEGVNNVMRLGMDRVYDPHIYRYLKDHGKHTFNRSRKNLNLNWFDRRSVSTEVSEAGLTIQTMDHFNMLEERLYTFNQLLQMGFPLDETLNPVNVHDMTDVFYDYTEIKAKDQLKLKCTLKPTFVVGFRDMKVAISEPFNGQSQKLTIPLILGFDLLPRNNLKNIEGYNPKVYLITWRTGEKSLRYASVISCELGMGIWSNFFADRVFFN